ncbi:MAG: acetylglucosamine transferase [Burkholderiales bacterium PBB4]|nr:MAG: acetylglucosamine transferase [Burkholderiales bacterium PBB4]
MSSVDQFAATTLLAYKGQLEFMDLISQTAELEAHGYGPLAVVLYETWLEHGESPYAHAVQFNLATVLTNLGELEKAEAAYRKSIAIAPGFIHPRLNLGLLHERQGRLDAALQEWQWVDEFGARDEANLPVVLLALNHLGRVNETLKKLEEATQFLEKSLYLNPVQPDVIHHWVFLRQKQCMWPVYGDIPGLTYAAMRESTSALAMLSLSDDPAAQLTAALHFVDKKVARNLPKLAPPSGYGHTKLRIGYCSSDFCLHPVSLLTVELFELHDRARFEVFGYCWSPEDGSAMRARVRAAMDHFFTIGHLADEAAAQLIREHEIDILVDLQGQTAGARASMLAYRPAPVQITYLGLPATTGLPSIDYVIADEFLIPPASAVHYSEKPLYMPDVYQVSDRQRKASPAPSRQSCGLPDDAFVFCSFNNSYKYTPEIFDVWIRLLKQIPRSVLWLLADNPGAEKHLRVEAQRRGVDESRLVFATRVSPEDYLARYEIADLFLDTFPFNAGTTANDCLWMACPLLTLTGRSFASRMAGALLTAAQLPELITESLPAYEAAALALARAPERLAQIRHHLRKVRSEGVLFDTPRFVRALEDRLQSVLAAADQLAQEQRVL